MVLLQSLPFKGQNTYLRILFKSFYIGNEAFYKSIFRYYLLSIWCSSTDMAKKPIAWMTIIRVTESTLWSHRKPCVSYLGQTKVDTQCFNNWWTLQPMEYTVTAAANYVPVLPNKFSLQLFIVIVCTVMVYKFAE